MARVPVRLLGALLVLGAALLGSAAGATADDAAAATSGVARHAWGFGWDNGIGMRHLAANGWGFGARWNPNLVDESTGNERRSDDGSTQTDRVATDSQDRTSFGVAAMIFREARISRMIGLGPFVELSYSRTSDWRGTDQLGFTADGSNYAFDARRVRTTSTTTAEAVSVGFRPSLVARRRFAVETRVGVILEHRRVRDDRDELREGAATNREQRTDTIRSQGESHGWTFSTLGQELEFSWRFTFMLYF